MTRGARQVAFRYAAVRDGAERPQVRLQNRGGASVRMDADAAIKRSFNGTFVKNDAVDWRRDRIRPVLLLDGVEYPLGEYAPVQVREIESGGVPCEEITGYDPTYYAVRSRIESALLLRRGMKYTDVIRAQLIEAGIIRLACEDSPLTLQTDRADWEAGTPRLEIVNALLREINYRSLWADALGWVHCSRYQPPGAGNVSHSYEDGRDSVLIAGDFERTMDEFAPYNVFMAYVSSPDGLAMEARAECPERIALFGARILAPPVRIDNIASSEALQEYVDRMKEESLVSSETFLFSTLLLPGHETGDVIALKKGKVSGIFVETGWNMQLSHTGRMTHTVRRVWNGGIY